MCNVCLLLVLMRELANGSQALTGLRIPLVKHGCLGLLELGAFWSFIECSLRELRVNRVGAKWNGELCAASSDNEEHK